MISTLLSFSSSFSSYISILNSYMILKSIYISLHLLSIKNYINFSTLTQLFELSILISICFIASIFLMEISVFDLISLNYFILYFLYLL